MLECSIASHEAMLARDVARGEEARVIAEEGRVLGESKRGTTRRLARFKRW